MAGRQTVTGFIIELADQRWRLACASPSAARPSALELCLDPVPEIEVDQRRVKPRMDLILVTDTAGQGGYASVVERSCGWAAA